MTAPARIIVQDVHVETGSNRLIVHSPWSPTAPDDAKAVGGGRFSKDLLCGLCGRAKVWSYPLDMETCRSLRRVYGERLVLGPLVTAWARQEVARERALPTLAAAEDADLNDLAAIAPRLAQALRPYQRVGAAFVREASKPGEGSLLADEPRTGKTLQAIAGVLDRGLEAARGVHLVVCPRLSVENVWKREIERWTDLPVYAAVGKKPQREAIIAECLESDEPVRFLVINYDMARLRTKEEWSTEKQKVVKEEVMEYPDLFGIEYASLLVDESHKIFGSLRVNKAGHGAGEGLKNMLLAPNGIRLAITGTPFGKGGRVQGLFGTLHWLRPKSYGSFWRWADRYLEVTENDYGHKVVGGLKKGMDEEAFFRSLGTVILRRTRAEVMPWLPGKVYEDVYVDMVPKQAAQYRKMEQEAEVGGLVATGVLAELTRLKQFANTHHAISNGQAKPTEDSGKLQALVERLDEHGVLDGSSAQKAIVFTQYEQFAEVVVEHLRKKMKSDGAVATITGKVSDKRRGEAVRAFQGEGGPRVVVMTTQTGGVSITLDRAASVHMLDEMWNPEDNVQAEDRAVDTQHAEHHEAIAVYYYRSIGTVEGYVRDTVEAKAGEQHTVLDGRRGLEYARRLKGQQ